MNQIKKTLKRMTYLKYQMQRHRNSNKLYKFTMKKRLKN